MPAGEACRECTTLVAADLAKETPLGVLTIANNQVGKIDSCVDSIEKVLRCDCGENCIMLDRKKPSRKKGTTPMPQHDKAPPKHDLLADEQAPYVVCAGPHHFAAEPEVTSSSKAASADYAARRWPGRGAARGGRPQRHGKRAARLGLNQGGCIVCHACSNTAATNWKTAVAAAAAFARPRFPRRWPTPPRRPGSSALPSSTSSPRSPRSTRISSANADLSMCITEAYNRGDRSVEDYADARPSRRLSITDASTDDDAAAATTPPQHDAALAAASANLFGPEDPAPAEEPAPATWEDDADVRKRMQESLKQQLHECLAGRASARRSATPPQTRFQPPQQPRGFPEGRGRRGNHRSAEGGAELRRGRAPDG